MKPSGFYVEAINEAAAHNQPEKYLGLDARELYYIESQLSSAIYYYIDGETGEARILEIPPDPPADAAWWDVLSWVLVGLQIVLGVIAIVFSFGAATPLVVFSIVSGVLTLAGGIAGLIALTADDPELAARASAFAGGAGAIGSGSQAMLVGGRMLATGGVGGKIVGGIFFIIGAIAFAFGANEVVSSITGYNAIKEWMGEDLYNGLYMGFTIAATIASIVGNIYLRNLAKNRLNPKDIRYTQDSIRNTFGDKTAHAGESIDDLIDGLKAGTITPDDIEAITVYKQNGKIYSINNRRLVAFKVAGIESIPVQWGTIDDMTHALTGNGSSIIIRGGSKYGTLIDIWGRGIFK